ncbi:MAG: glycosyltransferase family 4 protein, partial [Erysipelotrichaceae bacterium]|nr:glycosyltransferase family 4 protein [Erysipelotrichaceae bacterium]
MNGITEDIGVYIVGGEPEEHVLQYVKDNPLDNIRFIPFLNKEQLAEYYAAADCFVLPTRYDIWGLVINEAMAYGLPVISTDRCVAAVQFNEQCGNALIVPAEDVTSLREAIMKLYQDEALSQKLQAGSLAGIRDWSLENMKDDLISILNSHVRTV